MIQHLSARELGEIALAGGSLEIDSAKFDAREVATIATKCAKGATLKVFNSNKFSVEEMCAIAEKRPGQVIFA